MTVPATSRRAGPFNGNGVTTAFPFSFKTFDTDDIAIVRVDGDGVETTLVLSSDYSVTLNPDQEVAPGGSVTYPVSGTPLAIGATLSIVGALPYDQTTDLPTGGNYRAQVVENAFDRVEMQIQQLVEISDRTLTLSPAVDPATVSTQLPTPEANAFLGWNPTATALQNVDATALVTSVTYGTARADLFSGTGAQTVFGLTANPGAQANLDVSVGGVDQRAGLDYTWAGGTSLTFAVAPPLGTYNIQAKYSLALPLGTADGATTTFLQAGTGAVSRSAQDKMREVVSIADFGASPAASAATNTAAIQRAIDYVYSVGGGEVLVPNAAYTVAVSTSAEQFWFASITVKETASSVTCLVNRSGVTLRGLGKNSALVSNDRAMTVVSCVSMDGGGLVGLRVTAGWAVGLTGAGHGIFLGITNLGDSNKNLVFEKLEIHGVGSYGIGAQWGDYRNNRYNNLYIHDTGADGIDHKVRGSLTPTSRGVSFSNILCERYGQRAGIVNSAGIDVRGPASVVNYVARNFGAAGGTNVGIRFSAGTSGTAQETREPSAGSSLANFLIESDHSFTTSGVVLLSSEATKVSNGTIKNTNTLGVSAENAGSGYGVSRRVKVSNVSVQGVRAGTAFATTTNADYVSFVNCDSWGAYDEFSSAQGNLAAGQTLFTVSYDPATVQVYKNGTLLTNGVDVTVVSGTSVTLTVATIITDVIAVVTPNVKGFDIASTNCAIAFCATKYNTTPETVAGAAAPTLRRLGNDYEAVGSIRSADNGSIRLEVFGAATNMDFRVDAKGSGAFEARSNGGRAFRASNASASPVNWVEATGAAATGFVKVSAAGSDTNIAMRLLGKGSGTSALADSTGVEKVTANTTGVGFQGSAPISKPAVTGSRGGNAALASLLTTLATYGLITDSTTV